MAPTPVSGLCRDGIEARGHATRWIDYLQVMLVPCGGGGGGGWVTIWLTPDGCVLNAGPGPHSGYGEQSGRSRAAHMLRAMDPGLSRPNQDEQDGKEV